MFSLLWEFSKVFFSTELTCVISKLYQCQKGFSCLVQRLNQTWLCPLQTNLMCALVQVLKDTEKWHRMTD